MGLKKHKYGIEPLWSSLEWKPLRYLIKGDHQGAIDGRSKCKRPTDGRGIAEFDGQSALTYWRGEFLVYARANPRERGYRAVQVCRGELKKFKPFQPCKFTGVPDASDIYIFFILMSSLATETSLSLCPWFGQMATLLILGSTLHCRKMASISNNQSFYTAAKHTGDVRTIFQFKATCLSQRVALVCTFIKMFLAEWITKIILALRSWFVLT